MKAEERKELKQNTLVATLEKVGSGLKQGPSRRTVVVLGIILLVVLLYAVWKIATNVSESRASKRWEALLSGDFKDLKTKYPESIQGRAARLQDAREDLSDGLGEGGAAEDRRGIYVNLENGTKLLRSAADSFKKLADEFKNTPILAQECRYGAGQALEALGEFKEAIDFYEAVGKAGKKDVKGPFVEEARKAAVRVKEKQAELEKIDQQLKKG